MDDDFGGFSLPIKRRGKFSKDEFFKGFQDDYESAIDNVMDRFGARSMLADQFSNYRKIREKQDGAEAAASISDTADSYDIVIDMSDFVKGSLTVRTKSKSAIVDANFEDKKFHKVFPLPSNTNMDAVKSAMSDEGILTITAPKKKPKSIPMPEKKEPDDDVFSSPSIRVDLGSPEGDFARHVRTKHSSRAEVDEDSDPESPVEKLLSINRKGKFFQDRHFENVWDDFERAMNGMADKERLRKEQRQAQRDARRANFKEEISRRIQEETMPRCTGFDRAGGHDLDETLKEFGLPEFGRLSSYRNLRKWMPDSATQAITITKDSKGYKIVMDAKDYANDGDLSVKASEGSLLVMAGKGNSAFEKRLSLPGLKDTSQVNATMSEDGILTITAPI